jgi:hypothetical protein
MRWKPKDLTQWHVKFALWPRMTMSGRAVWLEKVERRLVRIGWDHAYWEFKTID